MCNDEIGTGQMEADRARAVERRPRLLLIAYSFPPVNKVGAIRAFNIAKYMTLLGWEVSVLTPATSVWRKVESPEQVDREMERRGIRCIRTEHRLRILSPVELVTWDRGLGWVIGGIFRKAVRFFDTEREEGWIPEAEEACAGLTAEDVELILVTGPPFAPFRLAQRLSRRLDVPYVLDYRDLWTSNPHAYRSARSATIQEEEEILAGCAAVTAISPSLRQSLANKFGVGAKVRVVTNGYDPEDAAGVNPTDFGHFAIVYTGVFYPPKRVIGPVMAALQRLKNGRPPDPSDWMFHYYGSQEDHVMEAANQFGVSDRVVLHGKVSRAEALRAVKGAGVSVVITSVGEDASLEDRGIITGKVFEAIGVRTPVMAVAPPGGDLEALLGRAGLGRVFRGSDVEDMAGFLRTAIQGAVPAAREPEAYSWPRVSREMDRVLRNVLGRSQEPTARSAPAWPESNSHEGV